MDEDCDAALDAMAQADPDLDPVWGLLMDAAGSDHEGSENGSENLAAIRCGDQAGLSEGGARQEPPAAPPAADSDSEDAGEAEGGASPPGPKAGAAKKPPISLVVDKAEVSPSRFPLLEEAELPPVTRWDVAGCDAFVLDGVLTPEECAALTAQADGLWSFWDDSETPRVAFRNACTVEVTHEELADRIWRRVAHAVNASLSFEEDDERCEVDIEGAWVPYAMNPKKLLSRYLDGGHFSPHTDGTTVVDFNRRTFYSCVLFLNESPWGGSTRIYDNAQMRKELVKDAEGRLTGDPALVLGEVPPVPGRMLVFYHRLMHEGVPAAEKYIIRTDVLYRRTPEVCTAPEDKEAFDMYMEAQLQAETGECNVAADLFRRAFKRSPALAKVYRM